MPTIPDRQPTPRERLDGWLDEIDIQKPGTDGSGRIMRLASKCKYAGLDDDEAVEIIQARLKAKPPGDGTEYTAAKILEKVAAAGKYLDEAKRSGKHNGASNNGKHSADESNENLDYRPFPVAALPSVLQRYVKGAAETIGCDESFVALPLLSAVAAAIGNTTWLTVKSGWHAPSCLWTAVVGESGTHKSPAYKMGTKFLFDQQRLMVAEHQLRMVDHQPDTPEPKCPQIITSDTTTEGLAELLRHNPRGLGMMRSELSGWFGSFNRYTGKKGADEGFWLQVFDGDALMTNRKKDGMSWVERPLVSVTGGIQPGVLATSCTQEHRESGMAARFLFAQPPRKPIKWTDAVLSDAIEARTAEVFQRLVGIKMGDQPNYIGMEAYTKKVFVEHYNSHHAAQAELVGDHAATWSKLIGYVPRLALVLHVAECADADCQDDLPPMAEASMLSGILIAEWFKNEANRVSTLR